MKQRILLFGFLCLLALPARPAPAGPDSTAIAEEEALRRQERKIVLDANLARARSLQKQKDFATAAKLYEETIGHAKLLGSVQNVEKQRADALAGLTHCRIQLATALQEKYLFKEADAEASKLFAFDPASSEAQKFKRFNDHVEAAHRGQLPSAQVVTSSIKLMEERSKVMGLVRDGKLYYEVGEYKEARERLEQAIQKDPMNDAAFYYLRLIMEAQFEQESRLREKTYGENVVEVTKKWNERGRTALGMANPYYKTN
ncbi:MAG: tetratricopeptide repeat protein, partial [Fibrobacterota bacterium]